MEKIYDVIIVGAGPAGISSAVECKKLGLKVALFEKTQSSNATITQYYKNGKRVDKIYKKQDVELKGCINFVDGTKETTLDLFNDLLKTNDIEVHYNSGPDRITKDGDLFAVSANGQNFKAKFAIIAIGKMGQPNKPSYPFPPKLRKQINFNVNDCKAGEDILVVGGGDSAVEYAIAMAGITKTTLNYRKTDFSRVNDENASGLKKVLEDGSLISKFGVDISSLEDSDSKLKVNYEDGTTALFDRIVYAIGGVSPVDFLQKCNVKVDSNGVPNEMDENTHESNIKNLFIAGDLLFKTGCSIAIGLNHGYDIAQEINKRSKN